MILTPHAREEMTPSDITEEDIRQCLEYGKLIIKQFVNGELRYGKQIDFKERKIVVIYIYQNNEE